MSKALVVSFSVVLCLLTASPVLWAHDSFPLSSYPMFAAPPGTPILHKFLVHRGGEPEVLPPSALGTSEVLQARALTRRAVQSGATARRRLCLEVAQRLDGDPAYRGASQVELVAVRYEPVAYFTSSQPPRPLSTESLTRCPVAPEGGGR